MKKLAPLIFVLTTACNPTSTTESTLAAIDPSNFVESVTNPLFSLPVGRKWTYQGKTDEGTERIEVLVTDRKKTILGIQTTVVWDRVWVDGELHEDTRDWYAQDKSGNVWYFGEDSKDIVDGKVTSTRGSWEAGVNGAEPGIIMKASPAVGDNYKQEFLKGIAEDEALVLSTQSSVVVPYGTFSNCLKTKDFTKLEPDADENKIYCKEAGNVVLEEGVNSGERIELLKIEEGQKATGIDDPIETLKGTVSKDEAVAIAIARVSGKVTDVTVEKKQGKTVWVVEIVADDGNVETDVIVDMETGKILAVET